MLVASKKEGDVLKALKWALTGAELFAVSVNGRNKRLLRLLECFDPIFSTKETAEAGFFTQQIFSGDKDDVEVLIDGNPFAHLDIEQHPSSIASLVGKLTAPASDSNQTGHVNPNHSQGESHKGKLGGILEKVSKTSSKSNSCNA